MMFHRMIVDLNLFSMLLKDIIVGYLNGTLIVTVNWKAGDLNDNYVL